MKRIEGIARKIGDHVDTDAIIPARYCTSIDPQVLGLHVLEGMAIRPVIAPGAVLVAGRNFGCGSAREHAALAIQGAGIPAVIAVSFSRTFFRNAINIALPVIELPQASEIEDSADLEIIPEEGIVRNRSNGAQYQAEPYPEIVRQIFRAGGLIEYARLKLHRESNER